VSLVDSLLGAIVRLDGDALVMHVGEKPYVVTTSDSLDAFRGPLSWGQVELATKRLTVEAVSGMLQQLLPPDQRQALTEYGALEYEMPPNAAVPGRFTVIAARGGDDIWLEIRYHRQKEEVAVEQPADSLGLVEVEHGPRPADRPAEPRERRVGEGGHERPAEPPARTGDHAAHGQSAAVEPARRSPYWRA